MSRQLIDGYADAFARVAVTHRPFEAGHEQDETPIQPDIPPRAKPSIFKQKLDWHAKASAERGMESCARGVTMPSILGLSPAIPESGATSQLLYAGTSLEHEPTPV